MTHQRALYLRRAESVTGHVQNIINAPDDPKITVFIAARAVACEIIPFEFAPILLSVACIVAVDRAQHRRPWAANNQFAADVRADFLSLLIDNGRVDPKERKCGATRLGWYGAGQRRNHDRSRFGLPPCIDDRTTPAADRFVVPHPCLWIDGLADCA